MIISSDLGRARDTAQSLANLTGLTVEIDEDLRETNGGLWEGKTGAENRAEDFQNFIRWIDGDDNPAGTTGERRSEVAERAVIGCHNPWWNSPMHLGFLARTSDVSLGSNWWFV
jgi:probable phosphoglycerate mutase